MNSFWQDPPIHISHVSPQPRNTIYLHWLGSLLKGLHTYIPHMCVYWLLLLSAEAFDSSLCTLCMFVGFFLPMGDYLQCLVYHVCISCSYAELLQRVQVHFHHNFLCVTWVILTELVLFRGILHPHKMLTWCCLCLLYMLCHDGLMQLLNGIPSFMSGPLMIMSALLTLGKTHVWTCSGNAHIINKYLL